MPDLAALSEPLIVFAGALLAGFVTGFAGFGTGLIVAGFWFFVLPPQVVPPLIVVCSVAAQVVGHARLSGTLGWRRAMPLISGGVVGVPAGVALLALAPSDYLPLTVGVFLVGYSLVQLLRPQRLVPGPHGHGFRDRLAGFFGGLLGGYAGLSAPVPIVWLQLRGLPGDEQRARYQPFNLVILSLAFVVMLASGRIDGEVASHALVAVPAVAAGAFVGVRAYLGISEASFRRIVTLLLLASGCLLVGQRLAG